MGKGFLLFNDYLWGLGLCQQEVMKAEERQQCHQDLTGLGGRPCLLMPLYLVVPLPETLLHLFLTWLIWLASFRSQLKGNPLREACGLLWQPPSLPGLSHPFVSRFQSTRQSHKQQTYLLTYNLPIRLLHPLGIWKTLKAFSHGAFLLWVFATLDSFPFLNFPPTMIPGRQLGGYKRLVEMVVYGDGGLQTPSGLLVF